MPIFTGLDWSEDVGGSTLVLAAVSVDSSDRGVLEDELARLRSRLGKPANYVFKHARSDERILAAFYPVLCRVPSLAAYVLVLDNVNWINRFAALKVDAGDRRVCHALAMLLTNCPDHVLDNGRFLIDLQRDERAAVDAYRTSLRKAIGMSRRPWFKDLRPSPDDSPDGSIIQAADMIAGEVRKNPTLTGPHVAGISRRITLV